MLDAVWVALGGMFLVFAALGVVFVAMVVLGRWFRDREENAGG